MRRATDGDLEAVAELLRIRQGGDPHRHWIQLRRLHRMAREEILVALLGNEIVGFGKYGNLVPPRGAPRHCIPDGWYLTGVVVHPDHRRQGIGDVLTRARLAALFGLTDTVLYFANLRNRTSIALHERFGFEEIARGVWVPGWDFQGGTGLLFRLTREQFQGSSARDPGPHQPNTRKYSS